MSLDSAKRGDWVEDGPQLFLQGLFEQSSTKKHPLGTVRRLSDGREFIYCKAGAANIAAGVLVQSAVVDSANVANLAVTAVANVGDKSIAFTMGDSAAANTANAYQDGYAYINTGAGNGCLYKIKSHAAIAANANGTLYLYDKLRSNISNATSKISLIKHPCDAVIVHPSPPTASLIGATTFPVTTAYYFWAQKKGPATVLFNGTVVNGDAVIASSAVDGSVMPSANGQETEAQVGMCIANNANAHWGTVLLNIN